MALTITRIPDCRAALGPSQNLIGFQLTPAAGDTYPTGGYVLTAGGGGTNNLGEFEFIFGAWQIACDHQIAIAYETNFVLASGAFGSVPAPQTSINMLLTQPYFSGTGANNEIPNGTNLSGAYWWIEVLGF
jgi:hypothetical protein